jgi:hypothetical protein
VLVVVTVLDVGVSEVVLVAHLLSLVCFSVTSCLLQVATLRYHVKLIVVPSEGIELDASASNAIKHFSQHSTRHKECTMLCSHNDDMCLTVTLVVQSWCALCSLEPARRSMMHVTSVTLELVLWREPRQWQLHKGK